MDRKDIEYETLYPLHVAALTSDSQTISNSLSNGSEVNRLDDNGRTALHYAAEMDLECVEVLLGNSYTDCDARDDHRDTPLHWAAYKGREDCVRCLLEHGADVNAQNNFAETPLFGAVMKTRLNVVRTLFDYNANPDVMNNKGELPIHQLLKTFAFNFDVEQDMDVLELLAESRSSLRPSEVMSPVPSIIRTDHFTTPRMDLKQTLEILTVTEEAVENERLQVVLSKVMGKEVVDLSCLTRYIIRKSLGAVFLPPAVETLPLPAKIKQFILLRGGENSPWV